MDLVARVALRYRLAQRYFAARDLPLGKTFQNELVRIHRYKHLLQITDLREAGKRGKSCTQLNVQLTANVDDHDKGFDELSELVMEYVAGGFDVIRAHIQQLREMRPGEIALNIERLKAINVEPYGEIYEFSIQQRDGGSIEVKSSPIDFRVKDRVWFDGPPDKPGFFQDTSYWPRKKKDAQVFYAWMKDNHERVRRIMNMNALRQIWHDLGVVYDSH